MITVDINSLEVYYELDFLCMHEELQASIRELVELQKRAGEAYYHTVFVPNPRAAQAVTGEALMEILGRNENVSDIRTHDIANCIMYHAEDMKGSVINDELIRMRREVDETVGRLLREIFNMPTGLTITCEGHYWYPAGGYMGWHTHLRKPGWRFYITFVEVEHRSFLRYHDPFTGEIVTSADELWNFRLLKITPEYPLWHCVYSETNRFSLVYTIETTPAT